ncbi:hypothetical protein [Hymenobacter lapidiphilus]|uniref:Uncharacterized protein n=1 Tax=Hymenobacter lapidiphilus TaxID=2608003 RepID=A0A7Y7U861_9BACT|nr:hypothetical protein [Hymenobacter lapidiphilus]NVO33225.1 hypothetical protein [Hymenobacter lapidiphilus]
MKRPPHGFTGSPGIGPPAHPMPQPARVVLVPAVVAVGLPRSVPTLTVYEDGQVLPNAEAGNLLSARGESVCFHAPDPVRPGRRARLWEVAAGDCHRLSARADKPGQVRLRAAGECPPPGRYLFTPTAHPGRFALVPV